MLHANALVFTPHGRDAAIAEMLLREAGVAARICRNLVDLEEGLEEDACFAVVTEESLRSADLRGIAGRLQAQPEWSDLAFIVLTRRGGGLERDPGAARLSDLLGNVTFLERPFHPRTFISVARTALKGRQRQYEARARMEELREGEERLRTALLAGHLGSWEFDISTGVLTASATFKGFFGRSAHEDLGYRSVIAAIHAEDRPRFLNAVRKCLEAETDISVEYRVVWPDGSIHWADTRARFAKDRRRGRARLVGVSSDITHRKSVEEHLRDLNETLEDRIAERTSELKRAHDAVLAEIAHRERAEEQLRQAQKMEMIGQLTGGVAHDFNNLLMAILGNLDLLRKHVTIDEKAERLIASAQQGAQRGAALTQRLLAFARRQDLAVRPGSLIDLVNGMDDLLRRSVDSQVELRIDLPEMLPPSLVDMNQLELALLNLVVNARDAMPDGGILSISADQAEISEDAEADDLPAGSYVRLIVSDTGHGMDAETLKKATEPFFSTKELGKGTGLGLSMIHGLALQLNGALRLSSQVGCGTRAELWLPVTAAAAGPREREPDLPADQGPGSKISVLVVDDDALIAMSTVAMLKDLGHEVIEANSGAQALEILRDGEPVDLLITDYAMPRMTGEQLAKAARELRPDLPILLVTGYAELPSAEIDLPRLAKPYQQDRLATEIRRVLKSRPA